MRKKPSEPEPAFLRGGGSMGARIRELDGAATGLGAPSTWPASLRTALGLVLQSGTPMFLCWGPQRITFCNDACAELLDVAHCPAPGVPAASAFGAFWPQLEAAARAAFAGRPAQAGPLPLRRTRDTGEASSVRFAFSPVPDESGTGGVLCCLSDETLRLRADALAGADRARTAFVNHLGHELRTPLALMLGPLDDLITQSGEMEPGEVAGSLSMVRRNGRRLLKLVETLLDFSRIGVGTADAAFEPVDLAALTAGIASVFREAVEAAGLELRVTCPPLPEPVYVDRDMWEKIVLNVVSNAFKFTFEGYVGVQLHLEGGQAILTVSDSGVGIPRAQLEQVFERFHRVAGTRARTPEGAGVGLAFVRELVHLHGGSVTAASDPGTGTCITIAIPRGNAHLPAERVLAPGAGGGAAAAAAVAGTTSSGARAFAEEAFGWLSPAAAGEPQEPRLATTRGPNAAPRVVVADPNADMREYVRRLLAGHEVFCTGDGEEALRLARELRPDIVLADVALPRLDGYALLRGVRADPRTAAIPVLLLSARAGEEARIEGLAAGADDYVVKPFAGRELLARIGAHVARNRIHASVLKRERSMRAEAEILNEVARDLASELDMQSLLQKVTNAGTTLTGAKYGAFFYNQTDAQGSAYLLYALSGAAREAFEKSGGTPRNTPLFEATFSGKAVVRVPDVQKDARYHAGAGAAQGAAAAAQTGAAGAAGAHPPAHGTPFGALFVRSYLAVPVISRRGEVLGGLFFGHPEAGIFSKRSERMALAVASLGAIAVDNAWLYERANKVIGDSIRSEAAWRESERRYRELVRSIPAAVYTTDARGSVTLCNDAAVTLWGRKPVIGKEPGFGGCALFRADTLAPLAAAESPMGRALAGTRTSHGEEIIVERGDGTRRHVLVYPEALRNGAGELLGTLNMLVDITEWKRAEAELAETKQDLALQVAALTKLHDLAMQLTAITELPPALQAILEATVRIHSGDFGLLSILEPAGLRAGASLGFDEPALAELAVADPVLSGAGGGDAGARRLRTIVEDVATDPRCAALRPLAARAGFRAAHSTPVLTRDGQVLGVLSVYFRARRAPSQREMQLADMCARYAADMIENVRNQESLRNSERLYRAIGESINYGVWIRDAEGRNVYSSESFLKLTGMTREQAADDGWLAALHPDDAERTRLNWQDAVRTGKEWDIEHQFRGTDGKWHPILARGMPVRNDRGEITGWAGINLDISRLKQVEDELREVDRRKNEFLATLAHELRNPLAPIRNGLEILKMPRANPQLGEQTREMMARQLAHMVRLIDDLLDLSRITQGRVELRRERTKLAAIVQSAVDTSHPIIEQYGHTLTVETPSVPIYVDGDITRLAQVFANLLNNAAKYTKEGGRIWLTVLRDGPDAVISVRDNGIGIAADMLGRVFEMFTQERSMERAQGGLGIGLSIARRLVEMHGGTITAASRGRGHGSDFVVRLPVLMSLVPEQPAAPPPAESPDGLPTLRVLVVDDHRDAAASMAIMCEMMGHEVRVAHDGIEAIEAGQDFQPDVVLLDIGMPRMNGYDCCRQLRTLPWGKHVRVAALTGWGQDEDRRRSREAGFDQHLVKPVTIEAVRQVLEAGAQRVRPSAAG